MAAVSEGTPYFGVHIRDGSFGVYKFQNKKEWNEWMSEVNVIYKLLDIIVIQKNDGFNIHYCYVPDAILRIRLFSERFGEECVPEDLSLQLQLLQESQDECDENLRDW